MKLALINNFPPKTGIGRYVFSLFHQLQQIKSVDCFMISTYPMDITNVPRKDRISFLSTYNSFTVSRLSNYFLNPFKIPQEYDVCHISNQSIGRFARFIHPSVITVYDVIPLKRRENLPPQALIRNWITRSLYDHFGKRSVKSSKYADKIICPSSFVRDDTMFRLGVEEKQICVVDEGVDHDLFKPREREEARKNLNLDPKKRIVLHVGNESDPRKNLPTLLRAFSKLTKYLDDLILIRVGTRTVKMATFIEKLGLKVVYYNDISDKKLAYLYNAADLFVLPSYEEGTATTALEAMSSGCPVIVSRIEGNIEIVGDTTILVNPFDIDSYVHWMYELLTNEAMSEDLRRRALKRSMMFSWKRCAQETVKVYQEVLKSYA